MGSGDAPNRRRKDQTEVSCCIKYLLFSFNVFFWLVGMGILGIGIWAWFEKEMFENIGQLTSSTFFVDPGLIFMIVGAVMFIIGFAGCIGALRENTCLLMFFMICLIVILLLQVTAAVLLFVYKDWVEEQTKEALNSYIKFYRDDPDLQNLIDWIQDSWLLCCGVDGPNDWDQNVYFNCSSPSREACGVPFSCCEKKEGAESEIKNLQCGYDARRDEATMGEDIHTTGCLDAVKAWVDKNLIPVASVAVGVAVVEIVGIIFAHCLRSQIHNDEATLARLNARHN